MSSANKSRKKMLIINSLAEPYFEEFYKDARFNQKYNLFVIYLFRDIPEKNEWQKFCPGEEYHKTCPQWPEGE